jgi:hypothetical protein
MRTFTLILVAFAFILGGVFLARQVGMGLQGGLWATSLCHDGCAVMLRDSRMGGYFKLNFDEPVHLVYWHPNGQLLMAKDFGGQLVLWPRDKQNPTLTVPLGQPKAFMWEPDGRLIWLDERNLYMWQDQAKTLIAVGVDDFKRSQDGRLAYTFAAEDQDTWQLLVWDGQQTIDINTESLVLPRHAQYEWNADGTLIFVAKEGEQDQLFVWDGKKTTQISQGFSFIFKPRVCDYLFEYFRLMSFSRDPFVFNTEDKTSIWTGQQIIDIDRSASDRGCADATWFAHWSADGKLAFTTTDDKSQEHLSVWDGEKIITLHSILNEQAPLPYYYKWSADGRLAFAVRKGNYVSAYIWDGKNTHEVLPKTFETLAPNTVSGPLNLLWGNNRLVIISDVALYLWENNTLTHLNYEVDHSSFTWDNTGTTFAFALYNSQAYVWDGKGVVPVAYQSTGYFYGTSLSGNKITLNSALYRNASDGARIDPDNNFIFHIGSHLYRRQNGLLQRVTNAPSDWREFDIIWQAEPATLPLIMTIELYGPGT